MEQQNGDLGCRLARSTRWRGSADIYIYIYIYIWRFAEGADLLMCTISDNFLYIFNHVCVLLCFLCVLISSSSHYYLQNIDPMWDRWPPEKLSGWICAETRKRSSYVIVFGEPAFDAFTIRNWPRRVAFASVRLILVHPLLAQITLRIWP